MKNKGGVLAVGRMSWTVMLSVGCWVVLVDWAVEVGDAAVMAAERRGRLLGGLGMRGRMYWRREC